MALTISKIRSILDIVKRLIEKIDQSTSSHFRRASVHMFRRQNATAIDFLQTNAIDTLFRSMNDEHILQNTIWTAFSLKMK